MTGTRIFLLGASGTIWRATATALLARGHSVVCFLRPGALNPLPNVTLRYGDVTSRGSIDTDGLRGERFDAVISCLASRSGAPQDAWAIDHQAHLDVLAAAVKAGIPQMILLSAICVQRPRLAFQHAKLAFEAALMTSGLTWSIVRPTAYFKSLSGQIDRVKRGKPFLLFGDGTGTACKPISDADLGAYIADCLDSPSLQNRILPIGGPGPAITPRDQGEALFALLGKPPKFRRVPVSLLSAIIATLATLGRLSPSLRDKAELARIGRYYATESMLVFDTAQCNYSAGATPETGADTLFDHYAKRIGGDVTDDRGAHAVF
jgi:divinyl chlorophyllide a 8-vinyl-reductase